MSLQDIVNVSITRQTSAVSRTGFGTILICDAHKRFTERYKTYSSLTALGLDFESTDKVYIAATNVFAQNPVVSQVAVGRQDVDDPITITVSTVSDSTDYTVTINGTELSFTSDATATAIEIGAGLVAAINAGAEPVTATDGLDGTFTLSADVAGTAYTLAVDSLQTITAFTVTETPSEALDAIQQENSDWYGTVWCDRTQAQVELVQAWIEANTKIFGTASANADIVDVAAASDTTSIAATSKASGYARSFVMYSADVTTQYPEAALLAICLVQDPGSYNAAYKTLTGITADDLTDTQQTNALAKSANIYHTVGGVSVTRDGTMAEPEYIDVIVFIDWLKARMTEGLYSLLVNSLKVPFTDNGIASVEAVIRGWLQTGINRGGLADDPAPVVSVPAAADVSSVDKAARLLQDVTFTATLTGAIQAMEINGTVTL